MPDFKDAKRSYAEARSAEVEARLGAANAAAQVKRLQRDVAIERRRAARFDDETQSLLEQQLKDAQHAADQARQALVEARRRAGLAHADFGIFTDPTQEIGRLSDDVPIALFPLRLETRFMSVGQGGAVEQHLCVRVFPDDVLVDSFQPQIGEAEFDNVVAYWTDRWRSSGDQAGHRAAWAQLVRSHGAGRAKWLTEQILPLNPGEEPVGGVGQYVLVVRPPAPLGSAEKTAVAAFWQRMWSSQGSERGAAFADLVAAVGAVRAAEIETQLVPVNLHDAEVKPSASLQPLTAFLDLPDPATLPIAQAAWTQPARARFMPERFVLLGFRGGAEVLRRVGAAVPAELQVSPDPTADPDDQIKADGADLQIPEALRWMTDFDDAVAKGMGFRVNLTQAGIAPVFDRLFVLGVRVGSDAAEGAAELAELIGHHQASRKGFSLLPQGQPTNNTNGSKAGHAWWEDPDDSFRHFFGSDPGDDPLSWDTRKDGAWLAGLLGVSPDLLRKSVNYYGTDQAEARAMNVALWPATLGYYMEQMLEPVFDDATVLDTRSFFNRFVIGRGTVPMVRIGRQPYGILPTTVWSKMAWWKDPSYKRSAHALGLPDADYLAAVGRLGRRAITKWEKLAEGVAHVGRPGPSPQQTLLDILGLHPTSAEFHQRYSQSFTQYYNLLGFATEPVSAPLGAAAKRHVEAGLLALAELGYAPPPGAELPELLEKIFHRHAYLLKGALVDVELSDRTPLRVTRADGRNYIDWLQSAARSSHDALRKQEGFGDDPPSALLYLMLHHALDLGFVDADLTFRREALAMTEAQFRASRKEPKFLQIAGGEGQSRWASLYRPEPAVTQNPTISMGDYIPTVLAVRRPYLNAQLSALEVLKTASTGALERALVEHVDCLTYRLDSWRMGLNAVQLSQMRGESAQGFGKGGIHLGAYGWLEDVRAKPQPLESAEIDPDLADIFDDPNDPPLMRDPSNFGHIHAPSQDHAVTAAILRNGHLANATPEAPDLLAVDLSSERVRWAQQMIEGLRNGQSLGALLGYRLERALHDQPAVYLDRLIYDLRAKFPLAANRNASTMEVDLDDITKAEARNVVDGVAFVEHINRNGKVAYPFGLSGLPALSDLVLPGSPSAADIGAMIDRCVTDMRRVADAVADLGVAESVYQVVRGNYDRAAGTLDAFSKGSYAPLPEVSATPTSGTTLTHRVALHLRGGLLPADPANTTPRSKAEPALARWIEGQLPDPGTVFARVTWRSELSGTSGSLTPSMTELGLSCVDLFYMIDAGGARDMPGFDDLLIDHIERHGAPAPRHDALFDLEYKPNGVAGLTLFELAPLVRSLRGCVLGARSLRPTDLALQSEAASADDTHLVARPDKIAAAVSDLQGKQAAVNGFIAAIEGAIAAGGEAALDAARDSIDQWLRDYAAAVRPVLPFGVPAASLTSGVEARRAPLVAMIEAIDTTIERWQGKQAQYDAILAAYAAASPTAPEEELMALLIEAGRAVSTGVIAPLPATITAMEAEVAGLRTTLDSALTDLAALRAGAAEVGATLIALTAFLPTVEAVDHTPYDLRPFRSAISALAQELLRRAQLLRDDIVQRLADASAGLLMAADATGDKAQSAVTEAAKAILGDAFLVLPEFKLPADRLDEWQNVWSNRAQLLAHLASGPEATLFPLDDWLHGVARVRDRMRHLEMSGLLADALDSPNPPVLEALQFPHRPNDVWLGLQFPETFVGGQPFILDEDKLLYTAQFAAGAQIDASQPDAVYSGLLLDEWVEVVPAEDAQTGLAFHFDRPNAQPPQAILLATPPTYSGAWQWQDLVDTLHETLDLARLRAVEPSQIDRTALGAMLPAVMSAVTVHPITAMLNFAFNNKVATVLAEMPE